MLLRLKDQNKYQLSKTATITMTITQQAQNKANIIARLNAEKLMSYWEFGGLA